MAVDRRGRGGAQRERTWVYPLRPSVSSAVNNREVWLLTAEDGEGRRGRAHGSILCVPLCPLRSITGRYGLGASRCAPTLWWLRQAQPMPLTPPGLSHQSGAAQSPPAPDTCHAYRHTRFRTAHRPPRRAPDRCPRWHRYAPGAGWCC